ncbi:MAG: flagellar M-ring protein FliF [Rhodospirillaceae bacterium]|nr:flagellar M-ring protein FliF [Rhodospirillaceae bacterium]MBT5033269.1 flagellar M-ring protein FliF [Rhodospirillaceae bacterium]MBT6218959.1 flagellar M-ring protein FliF [Rhodospirillaceae bacterium]MBT6362764.1 flagellar M-ring protein FliF [Rhodospirillaceae bacterium]MBT7487415.1 flagellar M-ring protein FliF [Rhodospirillales bacterium]
MDAFSQMIKNLGPMRLGMMGLVGILLVIFFIFMATRLGGTNMTLLYGDLDSSDSAAIVSQLASKKVPHEVRGDEVWVASDKVFQMRIAMAEQGLPGSGSIGNEIFDKNSALGSTNFLQNINQIRALQGELQKTITSLDKIKNARVHIVMPKRELFSREKQSPSASVVLNIRSGSLAKQQVAAIQHLVAAAVPSLQPNKISVVDQRGNLLAKGFEDDSPEAVAAKSEERRRAFESQLAAKVTRLLEKTVGSRKVQTQVSADIDFDRINTTEERFDPEGQVVRSTQSLESSRNSKEAEASPPVSVGTNLPDPNLGTGDSASNTANENRTEETVNFEISKVIKNHIRDIGTVKKISVAVLVDGIVKENNDGDEVYEPRKKAELELLSTLVKGAIGFDANRGDVVEIINMKFADPLVADEPELELFFGLDKNDLLRMAEILVLSIVAILVILLVVRPLVSRAFEAMPAVAAGVGEAALLSDQSSGAPALTGPDVAEEDSYDELIDIDRVEGRVKASSVKKVGEIVEKHPEEALAIVRSWMYEGE